MPWITAGLITSLFLIGAVVMREIVLRNARARIISAQHRLDRTLAFAPNLLRSRDITDKLTLERNAMFIREIKRKSEAAKVLSSVSGSHREVFELCAFYLDMVERELPTIGLGSPRLAALRRGQETAEHYHRYHMLRWAESEVRDNTSGPVDSKFSLKIEGSMRALRAVETALTYYADEIRLIDSEAALREHVDSLKARSYIEKAERFSSKGNRQRAVKMLLDAHEIAERIPETNSERSSLLEHIETEIQRAGGSLSN